MEDHAAPVACRRKKSLKGRWAAKRHGLDASRQRVSECLGPEGQIHTTSLTTFIGLAFVLKLEVKGRDACWRVPQSAAPDDAGVEHQLVQAVCS